MLPFWSILRTYIANFIGDPLFRPILDISTLIVLSLTALFGFFAAWATGIANQLKLLPLIVIYFEGQSFDERRIFISNLGEGVAFDIHVEPFSLVIYDIRRIMRLEMKLKGTNVLGKGEKRVINAAAFENGRPANSADFLTYYLDPEMNERKGRVDLAITFKNAKGDRYFTIIKTDVDGVNVLVPPTQLGVFDRLWLFYREAKEFLWLNGWRILWKFRQ
jgi:hypothetical protein